jgi:NAD-dependent deacetylase
MMDKKDLKLAVEWIANSKQLCAFTGAGISVESGIPAFRGEDGIWNEYDPDILDLNNYLSDPEETWPVIRKLFYQYFREAVPNEAHHLLATLESREILKSVITQNIDNLHQEAGSKNVIEYHGNSNWMVCMECKERTVFNVKDLSADVPRCKKDNALLKPDFVFFGEAIPAEAAQNAIVEAEKSDVMLLIGTTGEVMPASMIPRMAKNSGTKIIELNTEKSLYTDDITDLFLKGKAGEVARELLDLL